MLSKIAKGSSISCSPGLSIGSPILRENFFFIADISFLSFSSCVILDLVTFRSENVCKRCLLLGALILGCFRITEEIRNRNYCTEV